MFRNYLYFIVNCVSYFNYVSFSKYFVFFVFNYFVLNVVKLLFRVKFSFVTNIVSCVCYFVSISYLIYYVFLFRNYSYFIVFFFSSTFKLFFGSKAHLTNSSQSKIAGPLPARIGPFFGSPTHEQAH